MGRTTAVLLFFTFFFSASLCLDTVFPVFEQKAPPFDSYTAFPTRLCIPCRFDTWATCRSAHLQCNEDGTITELIWASSNNCSGRPTRSKKFIPPTMGGVRCLSQETTSPMDMDMSRFVPRLLKDHPDVFESEIQVENAVREYKKMLVMVQMYPTAPVVPSKPVDMVWHAHILDTQNYTRDCLRMFGQYLHHAPSFGNAPEDKEMLLEKYDVMLDLYEKTFGEKAPQVWNVHDKRNLTKSGEPNCCTAFCAKTSCAGCVGCDPVNCGTEIPPRNTNSMKGYVPLHETASAPRDDDVVAWEKDDGKKYTISPFKGDVMNFTWSIVDEKTIQFEQVFTKEAWFGFAIAADTSAKMNYADFMVSLHGYNYTGPQDLYRPFKGNNFPCMDNIVECGGPVGYDDLTNKEYSRVDGISTSRWQRLVYTDDPKDNEINTQGDTTVLFAYGKSDEFNQHAKSAHTSGTIDFFKGTSSWTVITSY